MWTIQTPLIDKEVIFLVSKEFLQTDKNKLTTQQRNGQRIGTIKEKENTQIHS